MSDEKEFALLKSKFFTEKTMDNLIPQAKNGYIPLDLRADERSITIHDSNVVMDSDRAMNKPIKITISQSPKNLIDWHDTTLNMKIAFCKRNNLDMNSANDNNSATVITATDNVTYTYPLALMQQIKLTINGVLIETIDNPADILHDKVVIGEIPYEFIKSFGETSGIMPDTSAYTLKDTTAGVENKVSGAQAWRTNELCVAEAKNPTATTTYDDEKKVYVTTVTLPNMSNPAGTKWGITNIGRAKAHDTILKGDTATKANWQTVSFRVPIKYIFDIFNVSQFIPHIDDVTIEFTQANTRARFLKVPSDLKVDATPLGATCQIQSLLVSTTKYTLSPSDEKRVTAIKYEDKLYPFRRWKNESAVINTTKIKHDSTYAGLIRSAYYITQNADTTPNISQFIYNSSAGLYNTRKVVTVDDRKVCDGSIPNDIGNHWFNYDELKKSMPQYHDNGRGVYMTEKYYKDFCYNILNTQLSPNIMTENNIKFRFDTKIRKLTEELTFSGDISAYNAKHIIVQEQGLHMTNKGGKSSGVLVMTQ